MYSRVIAGIAFFSISIHPVSAYVIQVVEHYSDAAVSSVPGGAFGSADDVAFENSIAIGGQDFRLRANADANTASTNVSSHAAGFRSSTGLVDLSGSGFGPDHSMFLRLVKQSYGVGWDGLVNRIREVYGGQRLGTALLSTQ